MEALDEAEEDENGQFDGEPDGCVKLNFITDSSCATTDIHIPVDSKGSGGGVQSRCPPSPMKLTPADSSMPNRRSSTGTSGQATNISLDKLTGDSLLSFSYSATSGGSGLNYDTQLGKLPWASLNCDLTVIERGGERERMFLSPLLPSRMSAGGSFVRAFTQGLSTSLSVPFIPSSSPALGSASGDHAHLFPSAARNPNKAIVTIDADTSRILVANEMTCELFGYQRDELCGMKVQTLFTEPYRGTQRALVEQNISASGELVPISGKVVGWVYGWVWEGGALTSSDK